MIEKILLFLISSVSALLLALLLNWLRKLRKEKKIQNPKPGQKIKEYNNVYEDLLAILKAMRV